MFGILIAKDRFGILTGRREHRWRSPAVRMVRMKRGVRILFIAGAVLSALHCIVSIVLWELGESAVYSVWRTQGRTVYEIEVSRGELGLFLDSRFDAAGFVPHSSARWAWRIDRSADLAGDLDFVATTLIPNARPPVHGFFFERAGSLRVVLIPMRVVVAVLALPPFVGVVCEIRRRRRIGRRADGNRCEACGYDLRATPERCPECGAVRSGTTAA